MAFEQSSVKTNKTNANIMRERERKTHDYYYLPDLILLLRYFHDKRQEKYNEVTRYLSNFHTTKIRITKEEFDTKE